MTIQVGTDTVFYTPHDVLKSALSDSILFLEKAAVGRAQVSDISKALAEYKRLFSVKLASPAEILTLSRAYPDNQKYAKAAEKIEDDNMPVVVGGPASVEMVDREGHLITTNALTKAFEKYMANFRTRNTMVMHSDVQVGWALPAYITKGGSVFRSGVDPRGLFFITELRNDTRIAAKVKDQIESGKMRSYSIAGNATESKDIHKEDGTKIMQVNNLELAEVTICEKGVNQGAHFDLMKGMLVDKEESTPTPVSPNDLLLEETLSKGIFSAFKKPPDLSDPKLRESIKTEGAKIDAQTQAQSAQREKLSDVLSGQTRSQRDASMDSAMADIKARRAANESKPTGATPDLNKAFGLSGREKDAKALKNFRSSYQEGGEAHTGMTRLNQQAADKGVGQIAHPASVRRAATTTYNQQRSEGSSPKQAAQYSDNLVSRAVGNKAKDALSANLNKSTPLLGMFQEFMEKEKASTDTPLGLQTTHPDHKGEEERRKQLRRVQQEFGLPEETAGAEYNRYAHVDYKHPHSFTSTRVVNQSGQDLASAQIGEHPVEDTVERLQALRKSPQNMQRVDKALPLLAIAGRAAATVLGEAAGENVKEKLNLSEKAKPIDKVLAKVFRKAGLTGMPEVGSDQQNQKYKEDRTPKNSPKPNEFPADSSPSPYQSNGLFEKAGDDLRQDGITNHPPRRSPITKPEDDRTFTPGHFEKQHRDTADIERSTPQQRAIQRDRRGAADVPDPDPEFESESSSREGIINPAVQRMYKRGAASRKLKEQSGEGWYRSRGKAPPTSTSRSPLDKPKAGRTGTTSRGVRQAGSRSTGSRGVAEQKPRYKNIDRSTIRKPPVDTELMQKQVRPPRGTTAKTPGMPQQQSKQGPTTAWGDPKRAAVPTMRQQMPWDETKSMEKNEGQSNPRLDPTKVKGSPSDPNAPEVLSAAARSRKRVAETAGKPAVTPYQTLPFSERGEREEKSLQKNEDEGKTLPSQPALKTGRVPTLDVDAAAANRARVEADKKNPPARPYRAVSSDRATMTRERIEEQGKNVQKQSMREPPKGGPKLLPSAVPTHDEAGAAASRARVEADKNKPSVEPYKAPLDPASGIVDREAKRKKSGWRGFPSARSEKSLSKEVGGERYANMRNPKLSDPEAHNKIQDNLRRTDGEAYAKLSPAERYTKVKGIHASSQPPAARRNPDLGPAPSLDARQKSLSKASTSSPASDDKDSPGYLQGWGTSAQRAREIADEKHLKAANATPKEQQRHRFRAWQRLAGEIPEKYPTPKRLRDAFPPALESDDPPSISNQLLKEDPIETGKAILAMPYNLATQIIMGKKAPDSVSADDRLKASVLILLKQQASAQEIGQSLLGGGDWDPFSAAAKGAKAGAGKLLGGAAKGARAAGTAAGKISATPKVPSAATDPGKRIGGREETTPVTPITKPPSTDPGSQRIGGGADFGSGAPSEVPESPSGRINVSQEEFKASGTAAATPSAKRADTKSAVEDVGLISAMRKAGKTTKHND